MNESISENNIATHLRHLFAQVGTSAAVKATVIMFVVTSSAMATPGAPRMYSPNSSAHHTDFRGGARYEEAARLKAEMRCFQSLLPVWAGEHTVLVSDAQVDYASGLVDSIPSSIDLPHVSPSADGEIGLSWIRGSDRFEAVLMPDERLAWITKLDGKFTAGEDLPISELRSIAIFITALEMFYEGSYRVPA